MIVFDDGPKGLIDRFFGGVLALALVSITLVILPVALSIKFYVSDSYIQRLSADAILHIYSIPYLIWIGFMTILSFFYGLYAGTMGVLISITDLWDTSGNSERTQRIWTILIVCGFITLGLILPWNKMFIGHQ